MSEGGVGKYKATAPKNGQKIDPYSQAVINYSAYLDTRHDQALQKVGGGRKVYDYRISFNGFAAEISGRQAAELRKLPNVVRIGSINRHSGGSTTGGLA